MKWGVMHYDNGGFFQLLQILRADVFDWLSNFLPSSKYRLLFNALNNFMIQLEIKFLFHVALNSHLL